MTLPSIIASRSADNISIANKFLEYGIEALLGDLEDVQQFGDGQAVYFADRDELLNEIVHVVLVDALRVVYH